jgi:hypothetical protein
MKKDVALSPKRNVLSRRDYPYLKGGSAIRLTGQAFSIALASSRELSNDSFAIPDL